MQRLPFQRLQHRCVGEGATPFFGLLHFTLDQCLKTLNVTLGSIRYHSLSISYIRGAYDKFPDFFRMGTFIDSTHMKL